MKRLITLFLIVVSLAAMAQRETSYPPIERAGWIVPDLSNLPIFDVIENTGSVTYLLNISRSGRVKRVKLLATTFNNNIERAIRKEIEELTLAKNEGHRNVQYKGTLEISLGACIDSRD